MLSVRQVHDLKNNFRIGSSKYENPVILVPSYMELLKQLFTRTKKFLSPKESQS